MTRKSIGLLSMAVACAAAISISASSCDNNPTTPGNSQNSGGKGPQVLDGDCLGNIGSSDCAVGEARIAYNENGDLSVSNMNGESGLVSAFVAPINVWHATVSADFPAAGGALAYTAEDADGNPQARVDIAQTNGNNFAFRPTFTSTPEGGKASYDVQILDASGNVVASAEEIDLTKPVMASVACSLRVNVNWNVTQLSAQCIWRIKMNPCCPVQWVLPDGRIVTGSEIKLIERNEKGFYIYLQTKSIRTLGTTQVYTQQSAAGMMQPSL